MSTIENARFVKNHPFVSNGNDHWISWPGIDGRPNLTMPIATGAQTGLGLTVAEHRWPAGAVGAAHTHLLEDEGFYVLEGTVTFTMPDDDVEVTASQGEFVWQPNRRRHGFRVSDDGPARLLQFLLPGTDLMPGLFERLGDAAAGQNDSAELVEWVEREFDVVLDVPEARTLPPRPRSTRGAGPDDGRPAGGDQIANRPFKSDRSTEMPILVGGGMMTNTPAIFHAFGRQTGNVFGLIEFKWAPGDTAAPHVHTLEDEGFYILDGEFTVHVLGPNGVVDVVAQPGDFVWAPRDLPHYYEVTGETGAHTLCFSVPGTSLTDFFYEITAEVGRGAFTSDEELAAFGEWASTSYGLHVLEPGEWPEQAA